MRPIIFVVLIALLNVLPVTQVLAQGQQQQPQTTQVRQSAAWLPPSLQDKAWKPVLLTVPRADSATVLLKGSGMSYMRTVGLAPGAKTRSRAVSDISMRANTVGTIVGVVLISMVTAARDLTREMSSQNLGASVGRLLSTFGAP